MPLVMLARQTAKPRRAPDDPRVAALYELEQAGTPLAGRGAGLTRAQVVQKFAHAPAQLFDVAERGFLREGFYADLVMVEDRPLTVEREDILSKCGWSPFEGHTFGSRVAGTWVNGRQVWDGTRLIGQADGQRLRFDR